MKENKPIDRVDEIADRFEELNEKRKQADEELLSQHPRLKAAIYGGVSVIYRAMFYATTFLTPIGREVLKDPERRRVLWDWERRVGFLEDSIFGNPLYFPNEEGTSLDEREAPAGRWVGYDFRRPTEIKSAAKKYERRLKRGRVMAFPLEGIINNDPEEYTPTRYFDMFNVEHILSADFCTLGDLADKGLVRETTLQKAYERVNLYGKYHSFIGLSRLNDHPVYQVTPKGNGLIFLKEDFGQNNPEPELQGALKPSLGVLRGI